MRLIHIFYWFIRNLAVRARGMEKIEPLDSQATDSRCGAEWGVRVRSCRVLVLK